MHHYFSWAKLIPNDGQSDSRITPLLLGKVAKLLNGENWLRRIIMNGEMVISLGYSITKYHNIPVTEKMMRE